ncbi:MAG: hypothetical protein IJ583_10590 [Firmicutes bacterium]|nr:hypothetical protein [Bacillota bacterium]
MKKSIAIIFITSLMIAGCASESKNTHTGIVDLITSQDTSKLYTAINDLFSK